jgi:hypothetical protein
MRHSKSRVAICAAWRRAAGSPACVSEGHFSKLALCVSREREELFESVSLSRSLSTAPGRGQQVSGHILALGSSSFSLPMIVTIASRSSFTVMPMPVRSAERCEYGWWDPTICERNRVTHTHTAKADAHMYNAQEHNLNHTHTLTLTLTRTLTLTLTQNSKDEWIITPTHTRSAYRR